jgi:hypothetical protein
MRSPHGLKTEIEAWQSLVHVCRRWRNLVFGSPRRLNLQLYCTPKAPARDTLDIWPTLPLIVRGSMASSPSTDNVIAALGQSNRVCQVRLMHLARWQSENVLAAMQVPFPELTDLSLSSNGNASLFVPDSFLGGSSPRLQSFILDGIPFRGLPNLLSSANHLVNLSLFNISNFGYISPKAIVALLSVLPGLRTLILEFQPPQYRFDRESRTPKRSVLPALYEFHFKGFTEYLEKLVTSIDTPQLEEIHITLINQIGFDISRLAKFVNRTPTLTVHDQAHVQFDDWSISVELLARSGLRALEIRISCGEPYLQLSSIAQVCNSPLHPLSTVEDLYIKHRYWQKVSTIENPLWLQLLLPFTAVKNLYLSKDFEPSIAAALQELVAGGITEVLPSLQNIFLEASGPFQEDIRQFITARQLSSHPVAISIRNELVWN